LGDGSDYLLLLDLKLLGKQLNKRIVIAQLLTIGLWLSIPLSLQPQQATSGSRPTASASQISNPPVVDGRMEDVAWEEIPIITGFVQREPMDGFPATERTEVRVVFDEEALYFGVWAYDSNPGGIIAGDQIRDYEVQDSDAVVMILDTYNDDQNGFVFGTTPAGIEYDGQVANEGQGSGRFLGGGFNPQRRFQSGSGAGFNKNWDGSWEVATSIDAEGWYAEFRIPFNTLRYGGNNETWGLNISRRIRRLNEESFWSSVPREFNLYRLNYAGTMIGLDPPFQRLGTVTPYVLSSTARNYEIGESSFGSDVNIGGEAKVQVTQGLTLDVTANTDFAQVEVDDQQINLTRFSLLFPEKRAFFLENAGFFAVGGGGADLFFSRKIGIVDGGRVPIKGGGRLSGKAGGMNLGLLHIQTGDSGGRQGDAYSVARVARELPNRSRIGALVVDRYRGGTSDHNRTYAADVRVGVGEAVTVTSFLAQTETPGLSDKERAFDLTVNGRTRDWALTLQGREIGENFNPEVGFLPRKGYRYYQSHLMRYLRPSKIFREIRPHVSYFTYRSRKTGIGRGFEESSRLHIDTHWEWPSGMVLYTGTNWISEGLSQPFAIQGTDVVVPKGSYDGWEAAFVLTTDASAPVSLDARTNFGSFLSGNSLSTTGSLTVRRGSSFTTSLRLGYNDVSLAEGEFETKLIGMNLGYFFTPRIYLQSLVQYSDQIDRLSANLRFGWLNTAGTGLFVVYNDIQGFEDLVTGMASGPLGRSLTIKYNRQLNVFGS